MFYRARHLFGFVAETSKAPLVAISSVDLLNYRSHIGPDNEWYLGTVSGFLKRWRLLGYTGVTSDADMLLDQIRLKGNPKGVDVATLDPVNGPFTALELEALQTALNAAYAQRDVGMEAYVLCWLLMMLGQRPTQYAALKVRDVVVVHEKDGSTTYSLRMPRAKRRDSDARGEFRDRVLTPEIGALVARHAHEVQTRFAGLLEAPWTPRCFPERKWTERLLGLTITRHLVKSGERLIR